MVVHKLVPRHYLRRALASCAIGARNQHVTILEYPKGTCLDNASYFMSPDLREHFNQHGTHTTHGSVYHPDRTAGHSIPSEIYQEWIEAGSGIPTASL